MKIDRARAQKAFADYAAHYNAADAKVKLKIDHTYRVAALCARIAQSLALPPEDVDLAWLSGILHDVGRFEQLRRYNTFIDAQSVSHAALSVAVLFDEGRIRDYLDDAGADALLRTAVEWHSAFRLPEALDDRTRLFCQILRDADKIDILRVNVETPMEEIYNVSTAALRRSPVTPAVLDAFKDTVEGYKLQSMGVILSYICPLMYMNNPLCKKKAVITNSNKLRTYTSARYYTDAEILDILSGKEGR
mgnify:FL=1